MTNNEKVRDFMLTFGQAVETKAGFPDPTTLDLRLSLIEEEVDELKEAIADFDIVEVADALTDILYVVYGAGHAFGIDLDACFAEVHRSNMSKLDANGKVLRREDGKVMKSDLYTPPNLRDIVLKNE